MDQDEHDPRVTRDDAGGRYEVIVGDTIAGYLTFLPGDGSVELVHTVVDQAFAGRGLAGRLAAAALDDARAAGLTVVPTCSFVVAYIERHPEYTVLLTARTR
jgi:predicted GNAT family acetyltransferase